MPSVKVSIIFVILIYINSVSTLNIHKSKRVLRKPIRVLSPPDSDISTENKYLLTATYGTKQNEEVFNKSSEEIYDNEQVPNKRSEETYNIQENAKVPNTSSEQTYNIQDDEQLPNPSSEETYDIQDDEQVPTKSTEQTFNSEEEEQGLNKSSEQIYNTKQYKQDPRKSLVRTESHRKNVNNEHNNSKTQKIFPKRTEGPTPVVPIIENENYVFAYNGDYHYSYKGGDGTQAFERSERRAANEGTAGDVVVGGYSYKDKDGNDYSLTYTAGENGYRPVGAHLPTPPPIPPAIQRVLRILATKTTPEPVTESLNSYDYN